MTKGIDFLHKPIVKAELTDMIEKYLKSGEDYRKPIGKGFFSDILENK